MQCRIDGHATRSAHQKRIAVGRRMGDHFGADDAARTATVVDDYRMPPLFSHALRHQPHHHIRRAARRKGDDHAQRFGGVTIGRFCNSSHCERNKASKEGSKTGHGDSG